MLVYRLCAHYRDFKKEFDMVICSLTHKNTHCKLCVFFFQLNNSQESNLLRVLDINSYI